MATALNPQPAPPAPPPTDLTSVCFKDPFFLNSVGGHLIASYVFDYFANSPFYDVNCNNQQLRMQGIHPLDMAHLTKMVGWEYILSDAQEPHRFILKKQKRDSPEKATPVAAYYILDGFVYQAPFLHGVIGSRLSRAAFHIRKAFAEAQAKLERTGPLAAAVAGAAEEGAIHKDGPVGKKQKTAPEDDDDEDDDEDEDEEPENSAGSVIDMREVVRVDQLLTRVFKKLPPAPPPTPSAAANEVVSASDNLQQPHNCIPNARDHSRR